MKVRILFKLFFSDYCDYHLDTELTRLHKAIDRMPTIKNKLVKLIENHIYKMGILIYFKQRTESREQKRKEKNID